MFILRAISRSSVPAAYAIFNLFPSFTCDLSAHSFNRYNGIHAHCLYNSNLSSPLTPATVILKNEVFINEGFVRDGPSLCSRNLLSFFRNPIPPFPEKEMRNMDKINKYDQNNRNARGAKRPGTAD